MTDKSPEATLRRVEALVGMWETDCDDYLLTIRAAAEQLRSVLEGEHVFNGLAHIEERLAQCETRLSALGITANAPPLQQNKRVTTDGNPGAAVRRAEALAEMWETECNDYILSTLDAAMRLRSVLADKHIFNGLAHIEKRLARCEARLDELEES